MIAFSKHIIAVMFFGLILTGCAGRFVNQSATSFEQHACPITEQECGVGNNSQYIVYSVTDLNDGTYRVKGEVKVDKAHDAVGARKWVEFWVVLMDQNVVVGEKKFKSLGLKYSFDAVLDVSSAPTQSALTHIYFWSR